MNNEKEKCKEIMRRYWEKEEEVREYRRQFFTIIWDGKAIAEAKKYLGSEEIKTLQKMEHELEELHKQYIDALNRAFD